MALSDNIQNEGLRKLARGMDAYEASKRKKVTVKIALTVEVDAQAWAEEFGTGISAAEIRQDVKTYFDSNVWDGVYVINSGLATIKEA